MINDRLGGNRRSIPTAGLFEDAGDGLLREQEEALAMPRKLRQLAGWYREFAERTGNPTIWEARLHTAEDVDAEADRLERASNIAIDQDQRAFRPMSDQIPEGGVDRESRMPDAREEATRQRAYALWEREGRPDGKNLEHWLRAEAEISGKKYAGVTDNGKFMEHPTGTAADPPPRRKSRSK